MEKAILIATLFLAALSALLSLFALLSLKKKKEENVAEREDLERMSERLERSLASARREIAEENARSLDTFARSQQRAQTDVFARQDRRLAELSENLNTALKGVDERMAQMNSFQEKNAQT
ncbi:MAG: hypothetical protein IKD18_04475, partial [Clostridia bacterium]|nr:hypothetical protein [Clostridia bacterium]